MRRTPQVNLSESEQSPSKLRYARAPRAFARATTLITFLACITHGGIIPTSRCHESAARRDLRG